MLQERVKKKIPHCLRGYSSRRNKGRSKINRDKISKTEENEQITVKEKEKVLIIQGSMRIKDVADALSPYLLQI